MFRNRHALEGPLQRFNVRWGGRRHCLAVHYGGGWWGRGSIIDEEMRYRYETYLPIDEYCRDLRLLSEFYLGDSSLVPSAFAGGVYLSVPDLWAALGDGFSGRVCFGYDELLPLFCNVAEPSRMGTSVGRYPGQLARLGELLSGRSRIRLLDLGCGVGLGTYELAQCCRGICGEVSVCGVTSEGLEVWMASHRRLPHDVLREGQYNLFPSDSGVMFRRGLAESYADGLVYDVIVCNGLAGGRYLCDRCRLGLFLSGCRGLLGGHGHVLLSNHFHEGFRPGVDLLCRLAVSLGWRVQGSWQSLDLSIG